MLAVTTLIIETSPIYFVLRYNYVGTSPKEFADVEILFVLYNLYVYHRKNSPGYQIYIHSAISRC